MPKHVVIDPETGYIDESQFDPESSFGGGSGAPTDAQYVTLATNGTLTNERVLTAGTGISITDGGAGAAATIACTVTGGLTHPQVLARGLGA